MKTDYYRRIQLPVLLLLLLISLIVIKEVGVTTEKKAPFSEREERKKVEATINNVIGWAVAKDFDLFFRSIGDDSEFISVTPYKRVKFGVDEVKKDTAFWASPHFKALRHEIKDLRIRFSPSGDVAWYYCVLDDFNEWKGEPANWENVRWTGVLLKRDGAWRVVQQHYSFPQE